MREILKGLLAAVLVLSALPACASRHVAQKHAVIYQFDPPEPSLGNPGGWFISLIGSGVAEDGSHGYVTSPNAMVLTANYWPGLWGDAAVAHDAVPVVAGQPHQIAMMVKADDAGLVHLRANVFDVGGGTLLAQFEVSKAQLGSGWQLWSPGSVVPTASTVYVELVATDPAQTFKTIGEWAVDSYGIAEGGGSEMAVMLTEYAVRAVLASLQAGLNAEIGYVELEAALGVDLPAVQNWREFDAGVATPDVVEVEVFESGDLTFPMQRYDQSQWNGGRSRVLSEVPIRVALNHANRGNADATPTADATLLASQMAQRSRLYAAAIIRTLRNDPTCNTAQTVILVPRAGRTRVLQPQRLDTDIRRAGRVEVDVDVRLAETPTNETQAGAGNLPSVTPETP